VWLQFTLKLLGKLKLRISEWWLNVLVEHVCEVKSDKMKGRYYTAEESQTLWVSTRSGLYLEKLIIYQPANIFPLFGNHRIHCSFYSCQLWISRRHATLWPHTSWWHILMFLPATQSAISIVTRIRAGRSEVRIPSQKCPDQLWGPPSRLHNG